MAMIKGLCFFVFGSLFATGARDLSPPFTESPLSYLSNVDRHHHDHFHGAPHQKRFCSCGKCSFISQFQQCCPLAHAESQPSLSRNVLMSFSLYAGSPLGSPDALPNSALSLEPNPELPPSSMLLPSDREKVTRQCFRSMGVQSCAFHRKENYRCMADLVIESNINEAFKLKGLLKSFCPLVCNHFIAQPSRPSQMIIKMRRSLMVLSARKKHGNVNPRDIANFALFLLLLGGDIEQNPGPTVLFRQVVKRLSGNIASSGLHTHQAILQSSSMSLFPESRTSVTQMMTLETLYENLCASTMYHDFAEHIIYHIVVNLLKLNIKDDEKRVLKGQADSQSSAVLESREIKFIELLTSLSYMTKENLTVAKVLPKAAHRSKQDAAELISSSVRNGDLLPTPECLKKLMQSITNDSLQKQTKAVLDAPEWVDMLKANVAMKKVKTSQPHIVEQDSPQSQVIDVLSPGDEQMGVPPPTIRDLATFPLLEDALEEFGRALSIDQKSFQSIKHKFPTPVKQQKELFRTYLKTNLNPNWTDIINALVTIGMQSIARQVVDTLELPQELLATGGTTVPASTPRVSKTEIHAYKPAGRSDSDKSIPKSRVVSDNGAGRSDSDKSIPKSRVVSDDGAILLTEENIKPAAPATFSRVSKTEILTSTSKGAGHHLSDFSKPLIRSRVVSDSGMMEETDSHFESREPSALFSPIERRLKRGHLESDSGQIFSDTNNASDSDGEISLDGEDKQSSKNSSFSSSEFHSAEETPLDISEKSTIENDQLIVHDKLKVLHDAVMQRNVQGILQCIDEDTSTLNTYLEVTSGRTALHLAASLGFKDVAKVLLQRKALVTVEDAKGCTPLYLAASNGNYEIAKLIIASPDCDMNALTKNGTPLLHDPASKGFSMICELLLENGANPLSETKTGVSPLYIASKNGHKDVVRILLKFGADATKICAETSKTPLQEAIGNEHIEVTKLLMQALSEVTKKNERLFECKTAERVHELIKHGASVDFRKANGSTPLIVHSSAGNKEVVQALIEEKANVDVQDNNGWSALMIASRSGHIEVVRSLIYVGAIPDLKNKEGLTALMFATLAAHINVIRELLLAKADPMLKRKDGRSAMEIAEQCGNQEITATLKRHTTSASSGNDPLFGLLGSYLELKKKQPTRNGEKAPHDHSMAASLKRRESLSSLLPPLPGATAKDDASTAKQELEKCYKRIADLETRIHDLTLQSSIEVPSETDLAHLDERRLRDEYSKLKELKRKAELYAVEAKQTAQRLSAENAKLREDLNKERKYNELTRANIVREFEHKVSHGGEKSAKMIIVEKEIEERAHQFLRRMPQEKGTLKRVELKAVEIKEMIFEKRVTINCLELAVMGLPGSGKSELLHQMLELKIDSTKQSSSLDFHQAVLCHDRYNDSHTWIKSTAEDCSVQPVSTALAKYLVCMHPTSSISGYMSGVIDPNNIVDEFSDFGLNRHFKVVLENIQKVAVQLESKGSLDVLKTSSLSIFNFANFKVGRVAHEISSALAIRSRNRVILNLVNLARYSPENMSLSDGEKSVGESNIQQGVMRPESALVVRKYMKAAYIASRNHQEQQARVILIGTHKDKINQGNHKEIKKSVEQITQGYAESAGIADAICPGMECINTKDEKDYQRLQNRILELINRKHNFQYEIPISYLFLLSYLQSLQQTFISRKRLTEIAHSCGLTDEDEIEEFLEIFNNCGSIINSSNDEIPILRDYIILNPYEFIKTLDKLDSIKTMSFSDKLELFEQVDGTRLGFISEEMAAYLWPGEGEGRMTQAHFILTVLKEFKAILPSTSLKLEIDIGKSGAAGGRFYFMPMLRAEYDKAEIQGDSNSLIITHNNAVLPFRLQTDMLLQIQNQFDSMITFDPKPYHNSIYFKLQGSPQDQSEVNIVIHFHTELVEVSVQFPNQPPRMATVTRIYSHLKSACVHTFQLLSTQVKELKYDFTLLCPHGIGTPSLSAPGKNSIHFVSFDPLMAGEGKLFCQSCQLHVPSQKLPWAKLLWLQVAYQGPIKDINNPKGYLSNEQITMVCQSLANHLSLDAIESFTKQLKSSKEEPSITTGSPFTGLESLLHFLIFAWKSRNPVNSVESLARILHTCGCYQEAMRLDPTAAATADQENRQPSLSDKEWSTIAAYLPQSVMKKLAESEPKGKVLNREAVSRKVAIRKLMELEYCSLAVALEIGWFS